MTAAQKKAGITRWYHRFSKAVKEVPADAWTSDKILSDFLLYLKYYTMSYMMAYDILEKDPSKAPKLMDGLKPMEPYIKMMDKKGGITAPEINQNANKMAKVSEAFYKFMEKEAKAAGVPVIKEVPKKTTTRT